MASASENRAGTPLLPLRRRPCDVFFVLFFVYFAWASFTVDVWVGFDVDLRSTGWAYHRLVHQYGETADPLFLANGPYLRYSALVSGLVCGPLYLFLIYGIVRGRSWVRPTGRVWAAAMFANMTIVFALEFFGGQPPTHLPLFLVTVGPYGLIPPLFWVRLRDPEPFRPGGAP